MLKLTISFKYKNKFLKLIKIYKNITTLNSFKRFNCAMIQTKPSGTEALN